MPYHIQTWADRIGGRSDLSARLVHLTRGSDDPVSRKQAVNNLIQMLSDKTIKGSDASGYICGPNKAVCFQDTPLNSITQNLYFENKMWHLKQTDRCRYLGIGLSFDKPYIFRKGGRPVIYETTPTAKGFLPQDEWWRIVHFDLSDNSDIIDWTHEREWRMKGDFVFELEQAIVLVEDTTSYRYFMENCNTEIIHAIGGIMSLIPLFY